MNEKFYHIPKKTKQETILEPFYYSYKEHKKDEKLMEKERTKILNIFNKEKIVNEYIDMYKKALEENNNEKK